MDSRATRSSFRKYGFACLVCRRKKTRCGGEKPACQNCLKAGDECTYKQTDARVARLQTELAISQARVQELERTLKNLSLLDNADRDKLLTETVGDNVTGMPPPGPDAEQGDFYPPDPSPANTVNFGSSASLAGLTPDVGSHHSGLELPQLSINEHGEFQYVGATSRFYDHRDTRPSASTDVGTSQLPHSDVDYHKKWLASQVRFQKSWETSAGASLAANGDISEEAASVLLKIFWTWQAPLHNAVYRACFYRDAVLSGPYCSPFLLNVIYAHACRHAKTDDERFARFEKGEYFLKKAKLLLLEEFDCARPRISTIQGLILLGGRQCAVGKSSEGWLYTGMAIRMVKDLGLHLRESHELLRTRLEPDDLEATKRVYLSAYAWDKSISLCLGRPPTLPDMPFDPDSLLDRGDDEELWRPFYIAEMEELYPATNSHSTLTFIWFCKLSIISNDIYNTIYSGKLESLNMQSVLDLEVKLRSLYRDLPDALRIEDITARSFCPPPHVLCLNILSRTLLILLFRPFFRWSVEPRLSDHSLAIRAKDVCIEEAIRVNEFFRAYGKTFKFRNQAYLISYCVYTAATIEVQQVNDPDPDAAAAAGDRLATTLNMLEKEAQQTPGIRKSIDIIQVGLGARGHDVREQDPTTEAGAQQIDLGGAVMPDTSLWPSWGGYDQTGTVLPDGINWTFYDMAWEPKQRFG